MNKFREVLEYIKNFFVFPKFTRKRRAEEPLDFLSPTKRRKIQHPLRSGYNFKISHNDIIDLSDEDLPRTKRAYKPPSSNGSHSRVPAETIILDDDIEIYPIKRSNETRFQRSSSKPFLGSAKYTSTPEDRPYINLSNDDDDDDDDDDVVLVKETKLGSSANPLRNDEDFPRTKWAYKPPSSNGSHSRVPTETIILDDDIEIYPIKRVNESRFQRSSSKPFLGSAKYTSTPEDRPYINLTNDDDDDDVVLVKETKLGSSANPLRNGRNKSPLRDNSLSFVRSFKGGETYLKPFTGSQYLKSLQQNGCSSAHRGISRI